MQCFRFVILGHVYPMLPVSLDCSFLIVPSVFSNVNLHRSRFKRHSSSKLKIYSSEREKTYFESSTAHWTQMLTLQEYKVVKKEYSGINMLILLEHMVVV